MTPTRPSALKVVRGHLTTQGEGSDAQTSHIHWPNTRSSGVTLGKGYDIGSRSARQVVRELTAAGMGESQARLIAAGAGLKGDRAGTFVRENRDTVGNISLDVQRRLLASMLVAYTAEARSVATSTRATPRNTNARGREVKEGKPAGTYRMKTTRWDALHPAMIELLTDLKYQGGYYLYDRVARVNSVLLANDGDPLAQFRGVAALFQGQDDNLSYFDKYGERIGERTNSTETFYRKSERQLAGASTRRNRLRLAYLLHVITALEGGRRVEVV